MVPATVPEAELAVILAHGALPVVALDAFFELVSQGRPEGLTGSQLLERWRAEPQRLACLPPPVSQFLGGGGRPAEQFVHGCLQLLELGATVSDPRQLTVATGLPPHVVNSFLASAAARAPRQGAHPGGSRPMA